VKLAQISIKMVRHRRVDLYRGQPVSFDSFLGFEGFGIGCTGIGHFECFLETDSDIFNFTHKHTQPGTFYLDHQCYHALCRIRNSTWI
jgi:hypothetical protein